MKGKMRERKRDERGRKRERKCFEAIDIFSRMMILALGLKSACWISTQN